MSTMHDLKDMRAPAEDAENSAWWQGLWCAIAFLTLGAIFDHWDAPEAQHHAPTVAHNIGDRK